MLKVLGKIFAFPIALILGFISFWINFLSKIAMIFVAVYNIGLFILITVCVINHGWLGVAIGLGFSFVVFAACFICYNIKNYLEGLFGFES